MVGNLLWETPTYLHWVICVGILFGEQFPTQWSFQHLDESYFKALTQQSYKEAIMKCRAVNSDHKNKLV